MVLAVRFRWFGWFVLCVGVILACYLMSSRVAAERGRLTDIEAKISSTERDIKALETEFDTRASFVQLNRWNTDTLRLEAPTAGQYVRDDAQLASLDSDTSTAGDPIQTASVTSAPAVPTPKPVPDVATATQKTASAPAPVRAAVAMVASTGAAKAQPAAAKAKVKPLTVALLDRKLMGDIERGARSEGRGQ